MIVMLEPLKESKKQKIIHFIVQLCLMLSAALFVVQYIGKQMIMDGRSMEPVIANQAVVLVNRMEYQFLEPQRYEVIAFTAEEDYDKVHIKRIFGLPGETVQIKEGNVYINGKLLDTGDYLMPVEVAGVAESVIQLGGDEYFVLGNKLDSSEDSRFESIGNVKGENIIGRAWFSFGKDLHIGFVK